MRKILGCIVLATILLIMGCKGDQIKGGDRFLDAEGYPQRFLIEIDGKFGYIDREGEVVIEPQFYEARNFSGPYAAVKLGDKWGYIGRNGNFTLFFYYDKAGDFKNGLARVEINGTVYYIDQFNNYIWPENKE